MNERIKELLLQAEIKITTQCPVTGQDYSYHEFSKEKFAELIVKECMLICRRHPSRNLDNNWDADAVAPDLVRQFEEHFGVEN